MKDEELTDGIYALKNGKAIAKVKGVSWNEVNCDVIIFKSKNMLAREDREAIENYYSKKLEKKVVLVDGRIDKILGLEYEDKH